MIPRIFEGETVFVVASGPSLKDFDFERLRGRNIIAINREHEFIPFATLLWWSDAGFYRRHRDALLAHPAAYKATCQVEYLPGEINELIHVYNFTGSTGFDPDPRCLRHGNNSAYAAMHLAAHLGAKTIVLLGVDMRYAGALSHHHGGHGLHHEEETLTFRMLPLFGTLAGPLQKLGITVLNASTDSALDVWPKCKIEDVLAFMA